LKEEGCEVLRLGQKDFGFRLLFRRFEEGLRAKWDWKLQRRSGSNRLQGPRDQVSLEASEKT
jgi:hypothetical protein